MGKQKKELLSSSLQEIGNAGRFNKEMDIEININNSSSIYASTQNNIINLQNPNQNQTQSFNKIKPHFHLGRPHFKKPNWTSKFRNKEKSARASKNIKNLMQDTLDSLTLNICRINKNKNFRSRIRVWTITIT